MFIHLNTLFDIFILDIKRLQINREQWEEENLFVCLCFDRFVSIAVVYVDGEGKSLVFKQIKCSLLPTTPTAPVCMPCLQQQCGSLH